MRNWQVDFYFESGRPFSRWIGIEFQHQPGVKLYYLEMGFFFFFLSISYDNRPELPI